MRRKSMLVLMLAGILIAASPEIGPAAPFTPQLPSLDLPEEYSFFSGSFVPTRVADDFTCDGQPIVQLTWWGSYWDRPDSWYGSWGSPSTDPSGTVDGFAISFWSQPPSGSGMPPWHQPGTLLLTMELPLNGVAVKESVHGTMMGEDGTNQTLFKYEATLPEAFIQEAGLTYWLSIQALDSASDPTRWRWQESISHWNNSAVFQDFPPQWLELRSAWWRAMPGRDMAFEVTQVPIPASLLLLASGLVVALVLKRHRRQSV